MIQRVEELRGQASLWIVLVSALDCLPHQPTYTHVVYRQHTYCVHSLSTLQYSKVTWICIAHYHLESAWYGACLTRRSQSFTCHPHTNHTCLYSPAARPHRPLGGIAPTHEGMARLSWRGWPVTYRDKCLAPGTEPGNGYPSQY